MKNWRNGVHDIGPPLHHEDPRPRLTKIGFNGLAVLIAPGPILVPAPSVYQTEPSNEP